MHKKPVARLSARKMPRMTKFVLRALVVSGSELPDERYVRCWCCAASRHMRLAHSVHASSLRASLNSKLGVVVEMGNDEIVFDRVKNRDGIAQWHKVKEKSAC